MTIDDFEWVEYGGFDKWYLMHKTRLLAVAKVYQYKGWHVVVDGQATEDELIVESFDAAKTIATMLAVKQIERISDVNRYDKRTPNFRPPTIFWLWATAGTTQRSVIGGQAPELTTTAAASATRTRQACSKT